jgi:hypothetical protein
MANPTTGTPTLTMGQPVNVGTFCNITATTAGFQIKAGEGYLYSITFNTFGGTGLVTLYDGTSTSGVKIGTITGTATVVPVTLTYNLYYAVGLFVTVATSAQDMTIVYR